MKASIIIVTRNRFEELAKTLASMRSVRVPDGLQSELLVVDNGSKDSTREVVQSAQLPQIPIRYLHEAEQGQCRGRNRGLSEAKGEFILFTDDDVRLGPEWLSGMCQPLADKKAGVVAGGVKLAPHLLRPWMTLLHRSWLASTEWLEPGSPQSMVGANMGFSKEVLRQVPAFDVELGPGALGFGDETLFASQLVTAGYQIFDCLEVSVEHHFDPARLRRTSWLNSSMRTGWTKAYRTHHWEHANYKVPRIRSLLAQTKLYLWRKSHPALLAEEGCSEEELRLICWCGELQGAIRERRRVRNYEFHGLIKRGNQAN